jgi:hypothetical protein
MNDIDCIVLGGKHRYFAELSNGWVYLTRMRTECEGCCVYDSCKEWQASGDTECLYGWEIIGNNNRPMWDTYDFNEPISPFDTEYDELYPNEIEEINALLKEAK